MTVEERLEKIEKWLEEQPLPHVFTPDTLGVPYCAFCGGQDGDPEIGYACPKRKRP